MTKRLLAVLLSCFPILVFAEGSPISFAPPASDYSMVFLGNLFGVVDGVLHGTGSQIMGTIFNVFNAAVLALGGIIIMYTLIVSTMNTAHEGQMLGQKWSSIWIPLRSTLGLALLIPKASGYCLMQIFVMWVVVQGVGAADKVWEAALGYLNRGGVIVQSQQTGYSPNDLIALINGKANAIPNGAFTILTGQVCMLGIQKQLEKQRQNDMDKTNGGRCTDTDRATGAGPLCQGPIPDFLGTVNFVNYQQEQIKSNPGVKSFTVPLPNFSSQGVNDSAYFALNGICGSVSWNSLSSSLPGATQADQTTTMGGGVTLTASQLQTAQLSRAIAIQQMYVDLSSVAQEMIGNDPAMSTNNSTPTSSRYSTVAAQQFGVPYKSNGGTCSNYSENCTNWGPDNATSNAGVLFNGTEFAGALSDYNAIMKATLTLINQVKSGDAAGNARAFIKEANSQGWMMAGAYFFDLVRLNGNPLENQDLSDTDSGLELSKPMDIAAFTSPDRSGASRTLAGWLGLRASDRMRDVEALIDGVGVNKSSSLNSTKAIGSPVLSDNNKGTLLPKDGGVQTSTVYAFVNNSLMVKQPGQPGLKPLEFANIMSFSPDSKMYYLQQQSFSCGYVKTFVFSFCLGALVGDVIYNGIIYVVYNALVYFFQQIIQQVIMAFIMIPIQGMSQIFKDGLATIAEPGVNPIIALANMGVMYINFSGNLWMGLMAMAVTSALIPMFGIFIFAVFAFVLPLLFSWIGIMVGVGFTTAYYIPILPYMIFTFGAIAWLISVIEAMVAAPIVALGVTHPEGHDAFGKGEAAIMLLMNVFLRPAMMIIGYISAIALSYVSVWILNAGFDHAIMFIQGGNSRGIGPAGMGFSAPTANSFTGSDGSASDGGIGAQTGSGSGGYKDWAGIYAYFFSILLYTTMYLTVVQKAFTLISYLPDKVLRWIGGSPESLGAESSQWGDEMVKGKSSEAAKGTQDAQGQMGKQLGAYGQKAVGAVKGKLGKGMDSGSATSRPLGESSASPPIK